jgi:CheY-like chemotaxis protein
VNDAQILIVDDEPQIVSAYREWLERDGYQVATAASVQEALNCLRASRFDVVLLDQRLPGSTETEAGLDLIAEATLGGGKVFIVTAHATEEAIDKAFLRGAHDYLTKERLPVMRAMLRQKVRRAVDLVVAERAASRTPDERHKYILTLWHEVEGERNSQKKGRLFEELLAEIFRTVPGFEVHGSERSEDEEFDLVITNRAPDWQRESEFILVEAKNWSSKVGPDQYDRFFRKLERRAGRAKLGFLFSVGGFTEGVKTARLTDRQRSEMIVLADRSALEKLVQASDRNAVLHELHQKSVINS